MSTNLTNFTPANEIRGSTELELVHILMSLTLLVSLNLFWFCFLLCFFWTYFSREKLVLINLNFSRENLLQLQLLKFILKCGNYRCTGAMIRCISINFKIGQFFLSENKTPFSIKATAVRVKISDTKINFFGLQSPYHRLANRKKLILPIEKYFKTLKGIIMGTIGI